MNDVTINQTTQYLSFKLGEEQFAVEITKIREVLDFTKITKVPRTPDFLRGVINLHGNVVPVVDLRLKFGMSKTDRTVHTCIIIMEVTLDHEKTVLGAIADSVQEVLDISPEAIEPPPKIGIQLDTEFINGMGKQSDEFIIILDIDKVFSIDELLLTKEITENNGQKIDILKTE